MKLNSPTQGIVQVLKGARSCHDNTVQSINV